MSNSIIFPSDDMNAYRITAPPLISDEDEDFLFKRDHEEKKQKKLTKADKKINALIKKKFFLQNYGILDEQSSIESADVSFSELFAYAILKKDLLQPALKAMGIPEKKIRQTKSNLIIRMVLSTPNIYKKISPSLAKIKRASYPSSPTVKKIRKKKFF